MINVMCVVIDVRGIRRDIIRYDMIDIKIIMV